MIQPAPAPRQDDGLAVEALAAGLLRREARALGRAISLVESGGPAAVELLRHVYAHTGRARLVGVTGPPGAGKSTLVDRLAAAARAAGESVAILAVDPTSPFSGGALLGDRIRMAGIATDPGVYIRSMATRGALGGLALATRDAIDLVDAAGFDLVLVETVGVGQDEVEVVSSVDSVLVVAVPGLGDDVQALKAGVLEIADLFVLNKADREGADRTLKDLASILSLGEHDESSWLPPIVRTVAVREEGISDLVAALADHRAWLAIEGRLEARRRARLERRVEALLQQRILAAARREGDLAAAVADGFARGVDPWTLTEQLFDRVAGLPTGAAPRTGGSS